MALLERGDIEFGALDGALRLRLLDYHAGPVHLSHADLEKLGLTLKAAAEELPSSPVLTRLGRMTRPLDAEPIGPAFGDWDCAEPDGVEVGSFLLAPVREGLDVFVHDFDAGTVLAPRAVLERIGVFAAVARRAGPGGRS